MGVYRNKGRRTYQYRFEYGGKPYKGNTYQENESDARLVEATHKLRLRRERGGIAAVGAALSIATWAGLYFQHLTALQKRTGRPKRLDTIDDEIRVVLRFWGEPPQDPTSSLLPAPGEEAPFHGLSLQDPIDEPEWIERFETWIERRNVSGQTRNHYMSRLSQLYAVGMRPRFRKTTGISMNPFTGVERSRTAPRKVALTPDLVLAWIGAMSYHTRLAVAIAALAPKLRLATILALTRDNLDPDVTRITAWHHKSDHVTGEPQIVPVVDQLRTILLDALQRMKPTTTHLIQYQGLPVQEIRGGLKAAAKQAGIPYGRFLSGGATFHSLRHTASTLLARLGVNPWLQRDAIGHRDLTTSAGYTHLQIEEQRPALEQLSAVLPMTDLVTAPKQRASRQKTASGRPLGIPSDPSTQKPEETRTLTRGALFAGGGRLRRKVR